MNSISSHSLKIKRLGINTYHEAIIYMRPDCPICFSEGFEVHTRIQISLGHYSVIATLNVIESDLILPGEAGLSNYAWDTLHAKEGDEIYLSHPTPLESLNFIHSKIYGKTLSLEEMRVIVSDLLSGQLSDIQIASFLTACAGDRLNTTEIKRLTQAMIHSGEQLTWSSPLVVDKHCVGGLPGNRTTLIVVPILAAFGLTVPKTSSRAITSPAGTADTMEVLAPVSLNPKQMHQVVEQEQGCIVWGGSVALSPADDVLIRVEKALDLDSEGQLIASILSKKIAAGSTHVVIDIPIGPTAKIRSLKSASELSRSLTAVGKQLGMTVHTVFTDGSQPVGRGIGPALEARDVLAVLQGTPHAPTDLRDRALTLAGIALEFSPKVKTGTGKELAKELLDTGQAWKKFQAICEAQGGMRKPTTARFTHTVESPHSGIVVAIDNHLLAKIGKLAGAPYAKAAGVDFLTPIGTSIEKGQPLFTIHAESVGELNYARHFISGKKDIISIGEGH
ncbi:thymidine phosphorylase family protein [Legionella anisa]|uniref:Putative thymidine phosphorylase n=1 Tax=Legionella anisa TaxID=28082 RepID=A0AAX0X0F2_9GAMM|nr:thymidine phosphorylase family protein [Legionella anisa]KTC68633.1 thymidine phosphorylase [Legionella anisa]PNL73975.1 thymidine phosphorylase [Legionella anisa]UAK81481.1 thymidine phosphorylase family protein [Legionella anisa]